MDLHLSKSKAVEESVLREFLEQWEDVQVREIVSMYIPEPQIVGQRIYRAEVLLKGSPLVIFVRNEAKKVLLRISNRGRYRRNTTITADDTRTFTPEHVYTVMLQARR